MAVSQDSLRLRIKRLVYNARPALRPYQDKVLSAAHNIADTTLDVTDGTSWVAGDIVEYSDGELAIVTGVAANVLTVQRAQFGTTEANHAQGTEITKNPRFGIQEIDDAIETVLFDLYPQVYVLESVAFGTVVSGQEWYPIATADVFDVLALYYEDPADFTPRPIFGWTFQKLLVAAEFSQTQGLYVPGFTGATNGSNLYILQKRKITAAADLLDRQEPLVAMGAVYQLLGGETVSRTHDPGHRTDRTVQPGQDARDSIWFLREYRNLLTKEEIRLREDQDWTPVNRVQARRRRFRP